MAGDKGQEAIDFLKQILGELKTMNQVNTQLVRQTVQLAQKQDQLINALVSKGNQERDTQYLIAELNNRVSELSEILTEEDPSAAAYTPVPYQQPSLGQVLGHTIMEGMGYQPPPPFQAPPRRGRRRRSG